MTTFVKFDATKKEIKLTEEIADRFRNEKNAIYECDREDLLMDLRATNANGCPLDFQKLLKAPSADFFHDIYGIRKYLNRKTGELTDFFDPRCSKPFDGGKQK